MNATAIGVCFRDASGNLHPNTFVGRLDSQARSACEGKAESCVSRNERKGGKVVEVRLSEVVK